MIDNLTFYANLSLIPKDSNSFIISPCEKTSYKLFFDLYLYEQTP